MKKLFVLYVFVFCLLALKGYTQETTRWLYSGESDVVVSYIDVNTLKYDKSNDAVTLYVKFVYKSDYSTKTGINYIINKLILYRDKYRYRDVSCTVYYNNGTIDSYSSGKNNDIIPDSVLEEVYIVIFNNFKWE